MYDIRSIFFRYLFPTNVYENVNNEKYIYYFMKTYTICSMDLRVRLV